MAFQRACRSRLASDLCRDAAHAGGAAGADQQDRPQRCARHGPDDAGGTLSPGACEESPGACEDATQSETANAADPPPLFDDKSETTMYLLANRRQEARPRPVDDYQQLL